MVEGIDSDLGPLDSCSQPVFKWSSLLLFNFPSSACVPEIMNCSNSNFNLGLEAWSLTTPWSSSNSLLLPTGFPLSSCSPGTTLATPAPAAILVTFYLLSCFFAGRKLNHFPERSDEHVASAREPGTAGLPAFDISKPFDLLKCLSGSTTSCILVSVESCYQQQSCHLLPQVAHSFPSASLGGLGMVPSELNRGTAVV